jgi:hypothetical protein
MEPGSTDVTSRRAAVCDRAPSAPTGAKWRFGPSKSAAISRQFAPLYCLPESLGAPPSPRRRVTSISCGVIASAPGPVMIQLDGIPQDPESDSPMG